MKRAKQSSLAGRHSHNGILRLSHRWQVFFGGMPIGTAYNLRIEVAQTPVPTPEHRIGSLRITL